MAFEDGTIQDDWEVNSIGGHEVSHVNRLDVKGMGMVEALPVSVGDCLYGYSSSNDSVFLSRRKDVDVSYDKPVSIRGIVGSNYGIGQVQSNGVSFFARDQNGADNTGYRIYKYRNRLFVNRATSWHGDYGYCNACTTLDTIIKDSHDLQNGRWFGMRLDVFSRGNLVHVQGMFMCHGDIITPGGYENESNWIKCIDFFTKTDGSPQLLKNSPETSLQQGSTSNQPSTSGPLAGRVGFAMSGNPLSQGHFVAGIQIL